MKINVLRKIIAMTKFGFYGLLLQSICFSLLIADDGLAQQQSIYDVYLSVQIEDGKLIDVFKEIESKTGFKFSYNDAIVEENSTITLKIESQSLGEVLTGLSKKTKLKFKRINQNIHISKRNVFEQSVTEEVEFIQSITITGKVTDENGGGLPGVNVIVKGTSLGSVTDLLGIYSLEVPDENSILEFSSVGYLSEEMVIGNQTVIDLSMTPDITALEEIVVIGYGTAKKSDLTGSVTTVKGDLVAERNTIQVSEALQGAMSGVQVTRASGSAPGSSATIRIRGTTTIGNSNPLILVDGVYVDNIDVVNTNDIENITVLKDAASAAIYGARAASGVIIITTKRAAKGQATLQYSTQYIIEKPTELPRFVGPQRYMELANEQQWNDTDNTPGGENQLFAQDYINSYLSNNRLDPNQFPITDWMDLTIEDKATRKVHELSFAMGTDNLSTKGSFKYEDAEGLWSNKDFKRYTFRVNNDLHINKYLSAYVDISLRRTNNETSIKNPMSNLLTSAPIFAAMWSDGRVASAKAGDNPWGMVEFGGTQNTQTNQLIAKGGLDFKPIEGLKISAILSPNIITSKQKGFRKAVPTFLADDPTVFDTYLSGFGSTDLDEQRNESQTITGQLLANYTKSIGGHNLNLLVGYEQFSYFEEGLGASRINYVLQDFPYLDLGPLEGIDNYGNATENAYRSFFGRIMYDFKSKYFLQANIRNDASSRFDKDYRSATFPSLSLGWVVSEESFLDEESFLSFLKLRGSWGQLGNERIGNYPYQSTIAFNQALFYNGSNVAAANTAAQTNYAIRDITWETTESFDIGIDVTFFDDRLSLTADYYQKTTNDMLLELEIPNFIGYGNPNQNTGIMETKGWDIEMGWRDRIGEVGFSVSANLSDSRSIMGDLGGTQFIGNQIKKEGSEFNEWYGYLSDGIYQTQEEVDNSAILNSSIKAGDIKYLDISGPEGEPDGIISPEYDRTLLGGSLPRFYYGGNIRLDYKGIDFSMVFYGVGKQLTHLSPDMIRPLNFTATNVPLLVDGNYWSQLNTPEENQNALYPRISEIGADGNNYVLSDYWLFNGAFFRMKNITLGYTLPVNLVEKIKLQGVRIYGSISDLFTIDNYPEGWDPEVGRNSNNNNFIYPVTTSYILGLSVKF